MNNNNRVNINADMNPWNTDRWGLNAIIQDSVAQTATVPRAKSPIIRTRFAPSPTGHMHLGNLRSLLFSWLWARHCGGECFVRLEDTDRNRSNEDYVKSIIDDLTWLGLSFDNLGRGGFAEIELTRQSNNLSLYRSYAEKMVRTGEATKVPRDEPGKYANCVVLNKPKEGTVVIKDYLRGDITYNWADVPEIVLLKSDGYPTYHLAHIADDIRTGITHVLRGDEYLATFPLHLLIYRALGISDRDMPVYIHLPLILSPEGTGKMSKRNQRGDMTTVKAFRDAGYLPDGLLLYLSRLGWGQEGLDDFVNLETLISVFDIANIKTSPGRINYSKLAEVNRRVLGASSISTLTKAISEVAGGLEIPVKVVESLKFHSATLLELVSQYKLLENNVPEDDNSEAGEYVKELASRSTGIDWSQLGEVENGVLVLKTLYTMKGYTPATFFPILRKLLGFQNVKVPVPELMWAFGQEEISRRILALTLK